MFDVCCSCMSRYQRFQFPLVALLLSPVFFALPWELLRKNWKPVSPSSAVIHSFTLGLRWFGGKVWREKPFYNLNVNMFLSRPVSLDCDIHEGVF